MLGLFFDLLKSSQRQAVAIPAQITSKPGERDAADYDRVIDQFQVSASKRYKPRDGLTWCNIFAWDVCSACAVQFPHWVDVDGIPAAPFTDGAHETLVNELADWIDGPRGRQFGWREVGPTEAQGNANGGLPTLAIWKSPPAGHGHVVVVRPAVWVPGGPVVAQAGSRCFDRGTIAQAFGVRQPRFYSAQ